MTAQIAEILQYEGQEVPLLATPLSDYFEMGGACPPLQRTSTALSRRYQGTWEIVDGRLYLVGLDAILEDGTRATLGSVFPDYPERVFAHWYTGVLRIPQGKEIEYVHMGFGSVHERDLFLQVKRGVVTGSEVVVNGTAADDAPEGYGVAAMTTYPIQTKEPKA